jgi:hypothetical protein
VKKEFWVAGDGCFSVRGTILKVISTVASHINIIAIYTGIVQPIRKSRHLPGVEKFGVKIRNWRKCTLNTEL